MHDIPLLRDLVIIVAVAIPVVIAAHRVHVPTIVGFLLTGIAIGPRSLALVSRPEAVSSLAEIGAVLLLFAIGLELSLSRIVRMGRIVLRGGAAQVLATMAIVAAIGLAFAVPISKAIFWGALAALSSTAIILKLYAERGELDTTHGRVAVAILLFQDLCVVPFMLLIPVLSGTLSDVSGAVRSVFVSLAVVGVLVLGGRFAVPWALHRITETRNREMFTLAVVFIGLGAAYLTSLFGLSLALGAFLAGLVISESEYGLQALSDVLPFRDTFSGIFFISVGMLLDVGIAARVFWLVLALAASIIVIKLIVVTVVVRWLKRSLFVALTTAFGLAQVGEFSFVLAGVGASVGLLAPNEYQLFLAAAVCTMVAAPFLVSHATALAERIALMVRTPSVAIPTQEMPAVKALADHVIIVGYGLNGRNLARALKSAAIPYVVLEQNGQVVRRARLDREPVFFGDGTQLEVLEQVGITRARVIVFAIASPAEERRGVAVARRANAGVRIVVRTRYVAAMEDLTRLGADEVVPEELETSIEIFTRVLRRYGVAANRIERLVEEVRGDHYGLLRQSEPVARLRDAFSPLDQRVSLAVVEVEPGSRALGNAIASLQLRKTTGATAIAAVRETAPIYALGPEFIFQPGDQVVLVGEAAALDAASEVFRMTPQAHPSRDAAEI
jgi:CPA2 family monovalent cation:H+ antiporter-2